MKFALKQLLNQLLRRTGQHLVEDAAVALQDALDKHAAAHEQLHSEVFARADQNDAMREKIKTNTALNTQAVAQARRIITAADSIYRVRST